MSISPFPSTLETADARPQEAPPVNLASAEDSLLKKNGCKEANSAAGEGWSSPEPVALTSTAEKAPGPTAAASTADGYQDALMHLVQVLSHRMFGQVGAIEAYVDLLNDTFGTEEQREMALRIFESASCLERILNDLKRYSQPAHPITRTLRADRLARQLTGSLEEHDAERVTLDLPEAVEFEADPLLIRQALLIVLRNALDVTADRDGQTVHLRLHHRDGRAVYEIWNEGSIELENPEQVFTPFFTTKTKNLGIGLSIARRIAKAHDGTLKLTSSSSSEGTCFSMEIPSATVLAC